MPETEALLDPHVRRAANGELADARVRRIATADLTDDDIQAIRGLLWDAFAGDEEPFTEADWQHALGGMHFVLDLHGVIVAHASVVERELHVADVPLRTGYVEAVATDPRQQGRGLGTRVMAEVTASIRDAYGLGALGTGAHHFYERLGWTTWRGPAFVRAPGGPRRTPDEEGYILVMTTRATPPSLDLDAPLSCDWREGDVW